MYFDYANDPKEHKLYFPGKYLAKALSCVVYKQVRVKGKENIPIEGALIIAPNHIAFSDPAIIVANCPRTVHFMAKSELFDKPLKAAFMRNMNAFPVKRNHFDRGSLRYAIRILKSGGAVGVFPEGKRVKNSVPTESKKGVAYLAKITGADILPVCIYRDPDDKGVYHSLTLSYGQVIRNSELGFGAAEKSKELEIASKLIMDKIRRLWEEENENQGG